MLDAAKALDDLPNKGGIPFIYYCHEVLTAYDRVSAPNPWTPIVEAYLTDRPDEDRAALLEAILKVGQPRTPAPARTPPTRRPR